MIDLNMKPKQQKQEEETPLGIVILATMPFALGFWWLLTQGLINGL